MKNLQLFKKDDSKKQSFQ